MKYEVTKQYRVEIPMINIIALLKKIGTLPADMKPEHNLAAGEEVTSRVDGPNKDRRLILTWYETEKVDGDGKKEQKPKGKKKR